MDYLTVFNLILGEYKYSDDMDDYCQNHEALANVDTYGCKKENFENLVSAFVSKVFGEAEIKDGEIRIYRKIKLLHESDLETCLGRSWSMKREKANAFCLDRFNSYAANMTQVLMEMESTFKLDDIDWKACFHLFLLVNFEHEEIIPKVGVTPTSLKLNQRDITLDEHYQIDEYFHYYPG
ncbi:hypothetical protein [Vibrio barjaei]|uniref:hypothetical protein n=1 Tax=Vibrio barjaei TaxID=1676683 RepID=UPI002285307B|nr:hypothetical protein [Vibrio barjaei]MCY9874781.1 hypothetical protein [Vibrio barjaei]